MDRVVARIPEWAVIIGVVLVSVFMQFPNLKEIRYGAPAAETILEIAEDPFSQVEREDGSHGEKKAFRLLFPAIVRLCGCSNTWHVYALLLVANILYLAACYFVIRNGTGDKTVSMIALCALALTYSGACGFLDTKGWADAVPLALVILAMLRIHPFVVTLCLFAGVMGDERVLMAIPYVILWQTAQRKGSYDLTVSDLWADRSMLVAGLVSVLAFGFFRGLLIHIHGFEVKLGGVGPRVLLQHNPDVYSVSFWSGFEALWLILFLWIVTVFRHWKRAIAIALLLYVLASVVACYMVFDVTRSLCYLLPALLFALVMVYRSFSKREYALALLLGVMIVCGIAPSSNYYGIGVRDYTPAPFRAVVYMREFLQTQP
ncbi:MAG: hypothetical protein JW706_07530 [Opitutales bacterium]|nr:hypothetical protein [Opitutales bacterium]